MKLTIFAAFLLFAATAFGQTVLSNRPQPTVFPDNPQHASQGGMSVETSLVGGNGNTYTFGHGERPLWEFGSPYPAPTPLGDVARAYRKEKTAVKKAEIVFEKQGS